MAVPSRQQDTDVPDGSDVGIDGSNEHVPVSTHCTNPDRTVFIEEGNTDGWIATDLTVGLDP